MVFTNKGFVVPSILLSSLLVYILFPHSYPVISITLLFVSVFTWLLYYWTNGSLDVPTRIITQGIPVDKEWQLLNTPIILRGDNKKEILVIEPLNLLYLHSADNYIRIFFRKNGEIHSILFRGTLKKLEKSLSACDFIMRCHKTYLVNLYHVHQIKGNASGLKLYITGIPEPIPVSRSRNKEILKRLSHLRHRGRI